MVDITADFFQLHKKLMVRRIEDRSNSLNRALTRDLCGAFRGHSPSSWSIQINTKSNSEMQSSHHFEGNLAEAIGMFYLKYQTFLSEKELRDVCRNLDHQRHKRFTQFLSDFLLQKHGEIPLTANISDKLNGAFFTPPQIRVIVQMAVMYLEDLQIISPGMKLGLRYSNDGLSNIWKKNPSHSQPYENVLFQLLIPGRPTHSTDDILLIAVAAFHENFSNLETLFQEMDLETTRETIRSLIMELGYEYFEREPMDWMALVALKDLAPPGLNHESVSKKWCPACQLSKGDIVSMFRVAPLASPPHLPGQTIRYDMGHAVARCLTTFLSRLFTLFPPFSRQKGQLEHHLASLFRPQIQDYKAGSTVGWKEAKHFIFQRWRSFGDLAQVFEGGIHYSHPSHQPLVLNAHYPYPPFSNTGLHLFDYQALTELSLYSFAVFLFFAYTSHPSPPLFCLLRAAARVLQFIFFALRWRLTVTLHYLTTHMVMFAFEDQGAYENLQEGSEGKNLVVKRLAHNTFHTTSGRMCGSLLEASLISYMLHLSTLAPIDVQGHTPHDLGEFIEVASSKLKVFLE
jgi:hypothetical protein